MASSLNSKNSCLGDDVYEYSCHGSTLTNVIAAQQPPGVAAAEQVLIKGTRLTSAGALVVLVAAVMAAIG